MKTQLSNALRGLSDLWSTTRFRERAHADYAERVMVTETQGGVRIMSVVLLVPLILCLLLRDRLGLSGQYVYTGVALVALCMHVYFSSKAIRELKTLHVLGIALLVMSGSAFVLLAHKTGAIGTALFSSVVLLFMVIPMVPWGLREASTVTLLVYGMFSASTWSISGRFEESTLWSLQAFMFAAGAVSLTLVGRGARVRKEDIVARYELEEAHRTAERQSLQDALTGAWNRRFLELEFHGFAERCRKRGELLHVAVLDIDYFKDLNDSQGHAAGDEALCRVSRVLHDAMGEAGFATRSGGDEFVLIFAGPDAEATLVEAIEHLRADGAGAGSGVGVSLSAGLLSIPPDRTLSLDDAYRLADAALYEAKRGRKPGSDSFRVVQAESSDRVRRGEA